jgi:hypothetical protein
VLRLSPDGEAVDDLESLRVDDVDGIASTVRDVHALGKTTYDGTQIAGATGCVDILGVE